jgi:hypothetical protein
MNRASALRSVCQYVILAADWIHLLADRSTLNHPAMPA